MTKNVIEKAIDNTLNVPQLKAHSRDCECILESDIGFYNTCNHNCIYCYANSNMNLVKKNIRLHNPSSPLLVGDVKKDDVVKEVRKTSYITKQLKLI